MSTDSLGRALALYRRTATSRSALVLLVANLIPLVGVVFFGWSLLTILVLYWIENGIIGFWNVPKIVMAQGSVMPTLPDMPPGAALAATGSPEKAAELQEQWRRTQAAQAALNASGATTARPVQPGFLGPRAAARLSVIPRTATAIFFSFHYGMFWLGHGIFVFALPAFAGVGFGPSRVGPGDICQDATGFPIPCPDSTFGEIVWASVLLGGIALFLSHGASFLLNYIGRAEYVTASPTNQMFSVYGRVIVLHLTIILGSVIAAVLGAPIGALLVLVVLKTAFDLGLHLREHRNAGPPLPKSATPA